MSVTRRSFVHSTLAGVAGLGLTNAALAGGVTGFGRPRRGAKDWDPSRLSAAVLQTATAECLRVRNRAARGVLAAGDAQSLSATMKLAFAHLEETGLPEAQEAILRERRLDVVAAVPREDDVERIHKAVVDAGLPIGREQFREMLSASHERKQAAAAAIEKHGVRDVHRKVMRQLERLSADLEKQGGGKLRRASCEAGGGQDGMDCEGLTMLIDTIGLICAMNAAGALVVPAFIVVAALEGILLAVLMLVRDVMCPPMNA